MSTVIGTQATGRVSIPAAPAAEARPRAVARLLYLDNLRILLISLVILVHLSITYGNGVGDWYYEDPGELAVPAAAVMLLFIAVCQAFFMGLLFFFAAYLTPASYERKGARSYVLDRVKRLGIALVAYTFVLHPLTEYLAGLGEGWFGGSFLDLVRLGYAKPSPGPTWFVEELLLYSLIYVVWRLLTAPTAKPHTARVATAPGNRALVLFALGVGLVSFGVRVWSPAGQWLEPLHIQPAHLPQYLSLFVLGIIGYRRDWLAGLTIAQARPWRWVAIVLMPVFLALALGTYFATNDIVVMLGGMHWQSLAYALWEQFILVAVSVTLVVWFRERLNAQGSVARAMSGASFSTYLLHAPTLVLLGWALRGLALPLPLKFVVVAPFAIALSFLVGHLARKLPLVREVL